MLILPNFSDRLWSQRLRKIFRQYQRTAEAETQLLIVCTTGTTEHAFQVVPRITGFNSRKFHLPTHLDGANYPHDQSEDERTRWRSGIDVGDDPLDWHAWLHAQNISHAIVAHPLVAWEELRETIEVLVEQVPDVMIIPDVSGLFSVRFGFLLRNGVPCTARTKVLLMEWSHIGKRAFDITLSFVAILLLSPLPRTRSAGVLISVGFPILCIARKG